MLSIILHAEIMMRSIVKLKKKRRTLNNIVLYKLYGRSVCTYIIPDHIIM